MPCSKKLNATILTVIAIIAPCLEVICEKPELGFTCPKYGFVRLYVLEQILKSVITIANTIYPFYFHFGQYIMCIAYIQKHVLFRKSAYKCTSNCNKKQGCFFRLVAFLTSSYSLTHCLTNSLIQSLTH